MLSLEFIGIGRTCILNRKLIPTISTYGHLTIKLIQLISIQVYIFKLEHVNEAERSL